jgi:glutamate--cysteine ligase
MTRDLPTKGRLATSMMRLTSSIQVNVDYGSEAEAIEMLRVTLAAAPISYALFANSPLVGSQETGELSHRHTIWQHTDNDRTGLIPEAFSRNFSFNEYAKIIWNYPLMYAKSREGEFVPANGVSLAQISRGKMPGVYTDEANLLFGIRQLFTEARLKPGYVEVRSIDGQKPADRYAATAFWAGILYHPDARRLVLDTLGHLKRGEREQMLDSTCRLGLKTKFGNYEIKALAEEFVAAAKLGLQARGYGEEKLLEPLEASLEEGICPADRVLTAFRSGSKKKEQILNYSNGRQNYTVLKNS